ncbi:MAG: type II secretion system protein [Planctomycetota bacterium]|jgi:prepilin-type N-terminal cleavage/methylation domain-containing protein
MKCIGECRFIRLCARAILTRACQSIPKALIPFGRGLWTVNDSGSKRTADNGGGLCSQSHRVAFTLIELLVVIAVIALLMGLLMPVLGRAREQGRRVACMGNIRQFIVGVPLACRIFENQKMNILPFFPRQCVMR